MKRIFTAIGILGLAGCAYPTPSIEQGGSAGHFRISDAPIGTSILIDGREVGSRTKARFDLFNVDAGRHVIEETNNGRILLHAEFMVGTGSTVDIRIQK